MKTCTFYLSLCLFLFGGMIENVYGQFTFPGNGSGTEISPYEVSTIEQLSYLRESGNKDQYFKLVNDIDLSSVENWDPIGDEAVNFEGKFDGNGFSIKNLTINRPDEDFVGLFGRTAGAVGATELKNVIIENATIAGDSLVGALLGRASASINNCKAININLTGRVAVGGLVGRVEANGLVTSSSTSGTVTGTIKTGGLIGESYSTQNYSISGCLSSSTIVGDSIVGGIIGRLETKTSNGYNIFNCASLGNVSGRKDVGGIVGYLYANHSSNNAYIHNLYSSGNVTGTVDEEKPSVAVGGICGRVNRASSSLIVIFENSFSKSEVAGRENVGGLVGWHYQNMRNRKNVLAANNVSGQSACNSRLSGWISSQTNYYENDYVLETLSWTVAGVDGTPSSYTNANGTDKTLSELQTQSTFETDLGWDFTNVWQMNIGAGKDNLPILKIAYVAPDISTAINENVFSNTRVWKSANRIFVKTDSKINAVEIYNLNGKMLSSKIVNNLSEVEIPFNQQNGLYIVKVISANKTEKFKIVSSN